MVTVKKSREATSSDNALRGTTFSCLIFPNISICISNSFFVTTTSFNRLTTTVVPSSSTALYEVPTLPFPNTSAEARSRSSKSKLYIPPSKNTSLFLSVSPEPPVISSFDDDVPASPVGTLRAAVATDFGGFGDCRRCRFRKQNNSKSSNNNAPTTHPTTIPIMAPVESFLDFSCTEFDGTLSDSGDGAGAGKKGLHGCNGPPHRSKLPAKEDEGNLARVSGIEPFKRLFETSKLTNLVVMLGSLPEKVLFSKKRPVSWVKLLMEKGIVPVKLLEERSKRVKRVRRVEAAKESEIGEIGGNLSGEGVGTETKDPKVS
ncbi:hypothetical protein Lal_00040971 [Lupinus albus]|nr:hypothetical protein Lal_00040971 [Lupinus albus]